MSDPVRHSPSSATTVRLLDYTASALDTFEQRPLAEADSLVFSQLAMVCFDGLVPPLPRPSQQRLRDLVRLRLQTCVRRRPPDSVPLAGLLRAERYGTMFTGLAARETKELLHAAAASPRFRDARAAYPRETFVEKPAEQFAAVAFSYKEAFSYVAFRGTDASFVGWRENFTMGYRWPSTGQAEALAYLEEVAPLLPGRLVVGGHSKGGNLAVYAAAACSPRVRDRIAAVYNHDGPGFRPEALDGTAYAEVAGRVHKSVPQESVVGVVLDDSNDFSVVRSAGRGIEQHGTFNWEIDPATGRLARVEALADGSLLWQRTADRWIASHTPQELERIAEALFHALQATGDADVQTLLGGGPQALGSVVESVRGVSDEERELLRGALEDLGGTAALAWGADVVNHMQQRAHGVAQAASHAAGVAWEIATGTEEEKAHARAVRATRAAGRRGRDAEERQKP